LAKYLENSSLVRLNETKKVLYCDIGVLLEKGVVMNGNVVLIIM